MPRNRTYRFNDLGPLEILHGHAIDYFRRLIPNWNEAIERTGPLYERTSFQSALDFGENVLTRLKGIIQARLETGEGISTAKHEINDLLAEAGVAPENPQYAEMTFRTNAMDAYNTGAMRQLHESREMFPVWMYANPDDGRSRPEHAERNGQYYPSTVPFGVVRGTDIGDVANCRCTFIPILSWQWEDLQKSGARLARDYHTFAEASTRFFADMGGVSPRYFSERAPIGARHRFAWKPVQTTSHTLAAENEKGERIYGEEAKRALEAQTRAPNGAEADPEKKSSGILKEWGKRVDALVNKVPVVGKIKQGVGKVMESVKAKLASRYGDKAAGIIMGSSAVGGYGIAMAAIRTLGFTVPGVTDLISIAGHVAIAESLYQMGVLKGKQAMAERQLALTPEQIAAIGKQAWEHIGQQFAKMVGESKGELESGLASVLKG